MERILALVSSLNVFDDTIPASTQWLRLANLVCVAGVVAALWAVVRDARAPAGGGTTREPASSRVALALLFGATAVTAWSIWNRWIEVNHFPSQNMNEVLAMFGFALLVSMIVLHFALGLRRRYGPRWAIVNDGLLAAVLLAFWITNSYALSLNTAQRDLPPALQSYWFPPHLSALIFSYATLGIAGILCVAWFAMRFWNGVLAARVGRGGKIALYFTLVVLPALPLLLSRTVATSEPDVVLRLGWTLAAGLVLVVWALARILRIRMPDGRALAGLAGLYLLMGFLPFAQFVTVPALVVAGLVFLGLDFRGRLPQAGQMAAIESRLDEVSYRAFSVGFPFLTGGLFMGAFWAQEAWANYWGWDSKENSALITWLVYVLYVHVRMLGGYRGEKAMGVLMGGALSIFVTFQVFGYLPDSQKSLHNYTDMGSEPKEGQQGPAPEAAASSARADGPSSSEAAR